MEITGARLRGFSVGALNLPYALDDLGNPFFLRQKSLDSFTSELVAGRVSSKGLHGTRNRDGVFGA